MVQRSSNGPIFFLVLMLMSKCASVEVLRNVRKCVCVCLYSFFVCLFPSGCTKSPNLRDILSSSIARCPVSACRKCVRLCVCAVCCE